MFLQYFYREIDENASWEHGCVLTEPEWWNTRTSRIWDYEKMWAVSLAVQN